MSSKDGKHSDFMDEFSNRLEKVLERYSEANRQLQTYLDKHFPTDIPNKVCNHAFIEGIKFENSFKPKVHDFIRVMQCGDEELFLWTHAKDSYSALVSNVSDKVKDKNFWKNVGTVIQLAYSYSRHFEHTMELHYRWCYYFDPNFSLSEQEIYNCDEFVRSSLLNGTILSLTDLHYISPIIELVLRDDKAYSAMSNFNASMKTHYCCLICELDLHPYKQHPSHEPKLWEQANVISDYEAAIVQACRCVEALIGKPPSKDKRSRFLEHKQNWLNYLGIDPDSEFKKGETTYIDFYYKLFELRNAAAHSFGTIPFELERKQAVETQCFASLLLNGYVSKNILSNEDVTEKLSINQTLFDKVDEALSTKKTL